MLAVYASVRVPICSPLWALLIVCRSDGSNFLSLFPRALMFPVVYRVWTVATYFGTPRCWPIAAHLERRV